MKGSDDILMTYLRVSQHMSRLFRVHFGRLQLTFPQALVLTVLGEEGPMPISTLAERTGQRQFHRFRHRGPPGEAGVGPPRPLR